MNENPFYSEISDETRSGVEWAEQYDSVCSLYTHPRQLCAAALVRGFTPPEISNARILELGCATGGNLTPIAASLPNAFCVGIDPFEEQITNARQRAQAAGVSNVTYLPLGVSDMDQLEGPFDFIIAHGLYSWISDEHRADTLRLCQKLLSPRGIAYISYNTYPYWHTAQVTRGLLRWRYSQLRSIRGREPESAEVVKASLELLKVYGLHAQEQSVPNLRALYQKSYSRLSLLPSWYLIHEYLLENNRAFYFEEWAQTAKAQDLIYLADASPNTELSINYISSALRRELSSIATSDISLHQACDLLINRSIRRSLLCHSTPTSSFSLNDGSQKVWTHPEFLKNHGDDVYVASPLSPIGEVASLKDNLHTKDLRSEFASGYITSSIYENALLLILAAAWPDSLSINETLNQSQQLLYDLDCCPPSALSRLHASLQELIFYEHVLPPTFGKITSTYSPSPSNHPKALQHLLWPMEEHGSLTNRFHSSSFPSGPLHWLIPHLDGTRDQAALVKILQESPYPESDLTLLLQEAQRLGLLR